MYKRLTFESMDEVLRWMNEKEISPVSVISIIPFQTNGISGKEQLKREYEVVYKEISTSTYI